MYFLQYPKDVKGSNLPKLGKKLKAKPHQKHSDSHKSKPETNSVDMDDMKQELKKRSQENSNLSEMGQELKQKTKDYNKEGMTGNQSHTNLNFDSEGINTRTGNDSTRISQFGKIAQRKVKGVRKKAELA